MLWLWLQREGTLALQGGVDIRMAVGFRADKERVPLEHVYRVAGYSVYFRQGNEFADPRAVVTPSFAAEGLVRRVSVIVHEEWHVTHGSDERNAYLAQLTELQRLGSGPGREAVSRSRRLDRPGGTGPRA